MLALLATLEEIVTRLYELSTPEVLGQGQEVAEEFVRRQEQVVGLLQEYVNQRDASGVPARTIPERLLDEAAASYDRAYRDLLAASTSSAEAGADAQGRGVESEPSLDASDALEKITLQQQHYRVAMVALTAAVRLARYERDAAVAARFESDRLPRLGGKTEES